MMGRKGAAFFLLFMCFLVFFIMSSGFCQQIVPEEQQVVQDKNESTSQAKSSVEKIIPSPKNIREGTALYVFVGWMWLAIFVLIYILRLKIKEVDRLYQLKFFSIEKK